MKLSCAVARQYSRCTRAVVGSASRRRPLSSSSLTPAIDSNHRADESATAEGGGPWVAPSVRPAPPERPDDSRKINDGHHEQQQQNIASDGGQASSGENLGTIDKRESRTSVAIADPWHTSLHTTEFRGTHRSHSCSLVSPGAGFLARALRQGIRHKQQ